MTSPCPLCRRQFLPTCIHLMLLELCPRSVDMQLSVGLSGLVSACLDRGKAGHTTFPIALAKRSMTCGFRSTVLVISKKTLQPSSTTMSARSYTDQFSFFLPTFSLLLMQA